MHNSNEKYWKILEQIVKAKSWWVETLDVVPSPSGRELTREKEQMKTETQKIDESAAVSVSGWCKWTLLFYSFSIKEER